MFKDKYKQCEFVGMPHKRHYWRKWWQIRERYCRGISLNPWLNANPSIGTRTIILPEGLERPDMDPEWWSPNHKHHLQLSGRSWSERYINGVLAPHTMLTFVCRDRCRTSRSPYAELYSVEMQRWEYNEMVLKSKPVYQTWPG